MCGRSRLSSVFPPARRGVAGALLLVAGLAGLGVARLDAADVGSAPGTAERLPIARQFMLPEEFELSPQARALSERYRGVFQALAAGNRAGAIANAEALEAEAFAADPGKAIEWLSQADAVLLGDYLRAQPDCALPLVLFYQRLVLAHAAHRRYQLIQRALRVADGLFEEMTLEATTQTERRVTADAYSGFAADLLTVPAPARAAEMLARGLELSPDDDDANVALAMLLLRDRRPDDAEARLDHVLKAHPGNREARLRRALMRRGSSADGRAGQELEKLATGAEHDWIALVAAQERVRRLLATGDFDKTIAFLNRVLERFPDDSSLRVALAFASARSSRRAEAYVAAKTALDTRAAAGEGARRIFAELPIRLLRTQAARAAAAGDERRESLVLAVAAATPLVPVTPAAPATPSSTPASGAQ